MANNSFYLTGNFSFLRASLFRSLGDFLLKVRPGPRLAAPAGLWWQLSAEKKNLEFPRLISNVAFPVFSAMYLEKSRHFSKRAGGKFGVKVFMMAASGHYGVGRFQAKVIMLRLLTY